MTINADITIANDGGAILDWNAEVVSQDNRIVSQTTYEQLRFDYAPEMISREDLDHKLISSSDHCPNELVVGQAMLTLQMPMVLSSSRGYRNLSGAVQIGVLMDDAWPWGMMDAFAQYTTDYTLHEIYTNWNPTN